MKITKFRERWQSSHLSSSKCKKNLRILYVHPKIFQAFFFISAKSPSWKIWVSFAKPPLFWGGGSTSTKFLPRVDLHSEVIELPGRCKSSRHGIRWAPGPKILGGEDLRGTKKSPRNDGSCFLSGKNCPNTMWASWRVLTKNTLRWYDDLVGGFQPL